MGFWDNLHQAMTINMQLDHHRKMTLMMEATVLASLGARKHENGEYQAALDAFERALALVRTMGSEGREVAVTTMFAIAYVYWDIQEFNHARQVYLEALRISRDKEKRKVIFSNLLALVQTYYNMEQYNKAIEVGIEVLSFLDDQSMKALFYNQIGVSYYSLGNFQRAAQCYEEALKTYPKSFWSNKDDASKITYFCNAADTYCELGDLQKAQEYYVQALKVAQKLGDDRQDQIRGYIKDLSG
jgi:tetratricopeptide (TPR) repeat protein